MQNTGKLDLGKEFGIRHTMCTLHSVCAVQEIYIQSHLDNLVIHISLLWQRRRRR